MKIDPVELAKRLISLPSITPNDAGTIDYLSHFLQQMGFSCNNLVFDKLVKNLYAELGNGQGKTLCFAGHIDVVPPGNLENWFSPPFSPQIRDGYLYGRGAADMKSAIAAFIAAIAELKPIQDATISVLLTSDEEGPDNLYGTKEVINWLKSQKKKLDFCIVGEPTNNRVIGDTIKIGRRGSVNFQLHCFGTQGHVAYPDLAVNPIKSIVNILSKINTLVLDQGDENFPPSNCEVTSIDVGNPSCNIIPECAIALFNIRHNLIHTPESLYKIIKDICDSESRKNTLIMKVAGDPFISVKNAYVTMLSRVINEVTGVLPTYSTSGGTSDARFIKNICPVIEFGLCNATAHKVNESCAITDIYLLTKIYKEFIKQFFSCS